MVDVEVPEAFTLDLGCPKCGGPCEVQFVDWHQELDHVVETGFVCPFCSHQETFRAPGRVAWATPRRKNSEIVV